MFLTMAFRDNNNLSAFTASYDVEANNGVNLNETQLITYHVLRKQMANDGPIYLNETTS